MEAVMEDVKRVKLIETIGRTRALLVESYLKANGIEAQLIQEAYYEFRLSADMGPVQILVPNYQLAAARKLYESSGWDFDTTRNDDDEEEDTD
jgi:hypothetical protein